MVRWLRVLALTTCFAAFAACGDDDGDDGGSFCSLGQLDCGCHPGFGCAEGLTCTDTGCADCDATPDRCMSTADGGT